MKAKRVIYADVAGRRRNRRDVHSDTVRLRDFERRENRRARTLRRIQKGRIEVPEEWGFRCIAGPKGQGKTLTLVEDLERDWVELGRPVFSNLGVEFGYVVTAMDIYTAIARMPENATLAVDEAHQPLASIGHSSYRNTVFKQMIAGLRKKNQKVWLVSSMPQAIDGSIMAEIDYAYVPRRCYPGRDKALNLLGQPALAAAPWAWIRVIRIGPRPWRTGSDRLFAPYKINIDGPKAKQQRMYIPPMRMWNVSKAYDTFAPLLNPAEAGMGVSAKDISGGLTEDDEWVDFGDLENDEGDTVVEAADPLREQYQQTRLSCFFNLIRYGFWARQHFVGKTTAEYLATMANQNLEHPACEGIADNLHDAYDPGYGPLEYQTDEVGFYVRQYCGLSGREFSIGQMEAALPPQMRWSNLPPPQGAAL